MKQNIVLSLGEKTMNILYIIVKYMTEVLKIVYIYFFMVGNAVGLSTKY